MGHKVAVALREEENWEKYDDFQQKVIPVGKTTKCMVQVLLYT